MWRRGRRIGKSAIPAIIDYFRLVLIRIMQRILCFGTEARDDQSNGNTTPRR